MDAILFIGGIVLLVLFWRTNVRRKFERALEPGEKLEQRKQRTRLFWSSNGFAFETPGKHHVEMRVLWSHDGFPYGVKATLDVWVDYPVSEADNEVAALLMHEQVGMFVALGGGSHLTDAVTRIEAAAKHGKHPACQCVTSLPGHKYSVKPPKAA